MTVALLDELAETVATAKRQRTPVEAPLAYTMAYVDLVLAQGYAWLGGSSRASELAVRAEATLARRSDDIHGCLVAMFASRRADASPARWRFARYPEALTARIDGLDRVARYKVDRLRESVRSLEPESLAMSAHAYLDVNSKRPALHARTEANDVQPEVARELDSIVEEMRSSTKQPAVGFVADMLDGIAMLPEALGMPIFVRAIVLVERARSAALARRALELVGRYRWGELAPELLRILLANVAAEGNNGPEVAVGGLSVACRLGLSDEVVAMVAALAGDSRYALVLAGARSWLGDASGRDAFLATCAQHAGARAMTAAHRNGLARQIAVATTLAPTELAMEIRSRLLASFNSVTDSFGTNSHFCLLVVDFVDVLVCAIVDRYDA